MSDRETQTTYLADIHGFEREMIDDMDGDELDELATITASIRSELVESIDDASDVFDTDDLRVLSAGALRWIDDQLALDEFDERGVY